MDLLRSTLYGMALILDQYRCFIMKLVKIADSITTISKTGNVKKRKQGIFLCPKCNEQVQKEYSNGLKVVTCGGKECQASKGFRHGYVGTSIYTVWANIKARCNNTNLANYEYYGGKGIGYPVEWETFKGFFTDMGFSYKEGLSIDRIDFNKSYSKENCQWIAAKENRIKDKRKLIAKYTMQNEFIIAYSSAKEASVKEGIKNSSSITKVARGERKQYKGFNWKYINSTI